MYGCHCHTRSNSFVACARLSTNFRCLPSVRSHPYFVYSPRIHHGCCCSSVKNYLFSKHNLPGMDNHYDHRFRQDGNTKKKSNHFNSIYQRITVKKLTQYDISVNGLTLDCQKNLKRSGDNYSKEMFNIDSNQKDLADLIGSEYSCKSNTRILPKHQVTEQMAWIEIPNLTDQVVQR